MWKDKLKQAWNENPLLVIGVVGFAAAGSAQLINSLSAARGRSAYARQVDYRINNSK